MQKLKPSIIIMQDIINFQGKYSVTSDGKVWSYKNRLFLKPMTAPNGYLKVNLTENGKPKNYYIHRLVACAFISNPENKPECNHIDGNKSNNNITNLEWCTHKENVIHSFRSLGRSSARGESSGMSKLIRADVIKIKQLLAEDKLSQVEIARLFTISEQTISYIKLGKVWGWT